MSEEEDRLFDSAEDYETNANEFLDNNNGEEGEAGRENVKKFIIYVQQRSDVIHLINFI